ncbi:MAG TPA: hypothetical protein V6D09_07390 [Leptolyngbyaceae cyanobacterium]
MSITRLERAEPRSYGETKKPKQFMITDSASSVIDNLVEKYGVSRSEILEWILRGNPADALERYKALQDKEKKEVA